MGNRSTIASLLEETRRELAIFGSDTLGVQAYLGQFARTGLTRKERRKLRDLVESSPLPRMIIDPRAGLHIIDTNDAYAAATLVERGRVAGEKLFEVFPDNPDDLNANGVANLYESLQTAAQSGRPHTMAVQRYDVRDIRGAFVKSYWRPTNIPIYDEAGQLIYLLHHGNPIAP